MKAYYILFFLLFSCSQVLYNHDDAMSMLISKQMVIDRFGEPTQIINQDNFIEYYYDFGVFEERSQNFEDVIGITKWRIRPGCYCRVPCLDKWLAHCSKSHKFKPSPKQTVHCGVVSQCGVYHNRMVTKDFKHFY